MFIRSCFYGVKQYNRIQSGAFEHCCYASGLAWATMAAPDKAKCYKHKSSRGKLCTHDILEHENLSLYSAYPFAVHVCCMNPGFMETLMKRYACACTCTTANYLRQNRIGKIVPDTQC